MSGMSGTIDCTAWATVSTRHTPQNQTVKPIIHRMEPALVVPSECPAKIAELCANKRIAKTWRTAERWEPRVLRLCEPTGAAGRWMSTKADTAPGNRGNAPDEHDDRPDELQPRRPEEVAAQQRCRVKPERRAQHGGLGEHGGKVHE
jgi:hypothetical protein